MKAHGKSPVKPASGPARREQSPWPPGFRVLDSRFVKGVVSRQDLPEDPWPQLAFLGRSNVGKSSLINALLERRNLVKVSSRPGKTQEINFFLVRGEGPRGEFSFHLVDLPGLGYAKVPMSLRDTMAQRIREYVENNPLLRGVVYLVDSRMEPTARDLSTVDILRQQGVPVLLVASKRDKLNQAQLHQARKQLRQAFALEEEPLLASSLKGTGLPELWNQLLEALA